MLQLVLEKEPLFVSDGDQKLSLVLDFVLRLILRDFLHVESLPGRALLVAVRPRHLAAHDLHPRLLVYLNKLDRLEIPVRLCGSKVVFYRPQTESKDVQTEHSAPGGPGCGRALGLLFYLGEDVLFYHCRRKRNFLSGVFKLATSSEYAEGFIAPPP